MEIKLQNEIIYKTHDYIQFKHKDSIYTGFIQKIQPAYKYLKFFKVPTKYLVYSTFGVADGWITRDKIICKN